MKRTITVDGKKYTRTLRFGNQRKQTIQKNRRKYTRKDKSSIIAELES